MRFFTLLALGSLLIFNSCKEPNVVARHSLNLEIIDEDRGAVTAENLTDNNSVEDLNFLVEGITVQLTATTSSPGFVFDRWEGVDASSGNVATVLVDSDKQVKAYFKASATNPVSAYGQLSLNGDGKIIDQTGTEIQLKGMSLFWSQWEWQMWNANVINTLADEWESSVVRASMGVEASGGYIFFPTELNKVETVVDAAIAKGMYVIIDWHSHYAPAYKPQALTFFTYMANKYGSSPNVIYEIYNEPIGYSWNDIKTYAQEVIDSIRVYDPDNLIIVGTPNWSQDVTVAGASPLSGTNIMYTLHYYAAEASHNGLRTTLQNAIDQKIPVFVTEWGLSEANGDGNLDKTSGDLWFKLMDDNNISWCNWSVTDKNESSAALNPGANVNGGWDSLEISTSGHYVRDKLLEYGGFSTPR